MNSLVSFTRAGIRNHFLMGKMINHLSSTILDITSGLKWRRGTLQREDLWCLNFENLSGIQERGMAYQKKKSDEYKRVEASHLEIGCVRKCLYQSVCDFVALCVVVERMACACYLYGLDVHARRERHENNFGNNDTCSNLCVVSSNFVLSISLNMRGKKNLMWH